MISKVQRTWMRPGRFYPIVAFNRRIPKLARMGKFGQKRFSFGPCTARFLFQEKRKWGVQMPTSIEVPPSMAMVMAVTKKLPLEKSLRTGYDGPIL